MNQKLVAWHNMVVKPEDHVYFLGDVTIRRGGRQEKEEFKQLVRSMHGHKTLFLGNHDHWPTQVYLEAGFEKVRATWRDQDGILYSHIPVHPSSMGTAVANVHGHIHNNQSGAFPPVLSKDLHGKLVWKPYVNVSVEVINYRPISLEDLKDKIKKETPEIGE